ncbi:hypothetical protein FOZ63_006179, partial [Perkinsus olseni]
YYELSVLHRIYPNRIVIGGSHGAEDAVSQSMHNFVYIYGKIAGVIRLVGKKKRRPPPGFEGQTAIPTRSIDFPGGRSSVKARAELETAFKEMLTSPPRQCSVVLVVRDTLEAEMFESWEEAVRKKATERGYELDRKCEGVVVFKTVLRSIARTVGGFVRLIEGYAQPNHTFILLRGAGDSKAMAQRSALRRRGFHVVPLPALPTRGTRHQIVAIHLLYSVNILLSRFKPPWDTADMLERLLSTRLLSGAVELMCKRFLSLFNTGDLLFIDASFLLNHIATLGARCFSRVAHSEWVRPKDRPMKL